MNILSATDFLPKSEAAIDRAGFLADSLEADLALVHAVAAADVGGYALEERMRRTRSTLRTRTSTPTWRWYTTPDTAVHFGDPAGVVLDQARRGNANLVVLGSHRNSGFPDPVKGSITEKIIGAAISPVLIVRREVRGPYQQILVALDNSPAAGQVVRAMEGLRLTGDGHATVVHAYQPPFAGMMNTFGIGVDPTAAYVSDSRALALAGIQDLLRKHSNDANRYEIIIVQRRPATAILSTTARLQPDLVVLGTRAHGRIRSALLGSVASDVARAAQCDVLLVPDRAAGVRPNADQRTQANQKLLQKEVYIRATG